MLGYAWDYNSRVKKYRVALTRTLEKTKSSNTPYVSMYTDRGRAGPDMMSPRKSRKKGQSSSIDHNRENFAWRFTSL
ncbi:unnamed protein product [marine sediment metagenome]|uniref:Uncharacterized protein n=1 Tax=marine sediment metagenome TaxID=412755 RepID=X1PSM7_9ZZZZ